MSHQESFWPAAQPGSARLVLRVTTAGGCWVARSTNLTMVAAQVRALVEQRLPAWVRSSDGVIVEFRIIDDRWTAIPDRPEPPHRTASWWQTVLDLLDQFATTPRPPAEGTLP